MSHISTPFNWSFLSPQATPTIQKKNYNDYAQISKNFIESYCLDFSKHHTELHKYYTQSSSLTISIIQNAGVSTFEISGYDNIKNKMQELNISKAMFSELKLTAQPAGNKRILISVVGKIILGEKLDKFTTVNTFLINSSLSQWKIVNHIFDIYT